MRDALRHIAQKHRAQGALLRMAHSSRSGRSRSGCLLSLRCSQVAKNEPARAVAVSVAAKACLVLVNPEMLDNRLVTLKFDQIPAGRAMQLIADVDGMRAVFDDRRVRFEAK